MSEIDQIMKGLQNHPGVIGAMVMNAAGLPIRYTFKDAEAVHYAALISEFIRKAITTVSSLIPSTSMDSIRIRSFKNEIIITPDLKNDIILVVVQDANA